MLLDIECMPGAELSEVLGNNTFRGKINVRLGPVALAFDGIVKFGEIDEAQHTARVSAQGTDAKGRGGANASSQFRVEPTDRVSKMLVHSNLLLSGSVAQYERGVGIIQATAGIMNQFSKNLREHLAQQRAPIAVAPSGSPTSETPSVARASEPQSAKPISGFWLIQQVLWDWLKGLFKRRSS